MKLEKLTLRLEGDSIVRPKRVARERRHEASDAEPLDNDERRPAVLAAFVGRGT